jgi:hypothetical protein
MTGRALALVCLLVTAACTGSVAGSSRNNNDPARPGAGPGSGGQGSGGAAGGGTSAPGPGGGTPGSPPAGGGVAPQPDAGASVPGNQADGGVPATSGCTVSIQPVNPPRLIDLLAGETARLRVQARAAGAMAPAAPDWQWQVQLGGFSDVAVTRLTTAGDTVEIPLRSEGIYFIRASAGSGCTGQVSASALRPGDRVTTYWARVSPPRTTGLPTQEASIEVGGGRPTAKVIALIRGVEVALDPKNDRGEAIRSYIRISSPRTSVRFEGNNLLQAFRADLHPTFPYDVLIVPEGSEAPVLITGRTAAMLRGDPFMFDPGLAVAGTVQRTEAAGAQPVAGARVYLRAGNLPSSIGQTGATGTFELRARDGAFQVSVLPAVGSGLPEARLPDGTSYLPGSEPNTVELTYAAIGMVAAELPVRTTDGQRPVAGARVRLDAAPASLGTVGTFRLSPDGREVAAVGALRIEATTGPTGIASFPRLPAGRYRALIVPPAGMADAASTMTTVEVRAGAALAPVALVRPVKLSGRLLPVTLSAGLKLLAIEADGPSPGEAVTATVDATGQFVLPMSPGRSYRLQIEPAQERRLPRLFLGPHTAGAGDSFYGELTLFEGVTFVGTVTNGADPVPDAVVQVFCTGAPPDCVDPNAPQLEAARPLAETKAGADGRFQVHLPDPARWDL